MAGILMLSVQYIFDESHSLFSKFDCGFIDSLSWACNHKIYFLAWLWMSICFNCTPGWGKNRPAQSNFEIEVIRWWEMTKIYFLAFFGWWKRIFFDVAKELQMCSHCWRKIHQMQELPSWFIAVRLAVRLSYRKRARIAQDEAIRRTRTRQTPACCKSNHARSNNSCSSWGKIPLKKQ